MEMMMPNKIVSISYEIDQNGIDQLKTPSSDVGKWMKQIAEKVTRRSKYYLDNRMVNRRTSNLYHSVTTRSINKTPPEWEVVADTPYAWYVHDLNNRPFISVALRDVFTNEGLL